MNWIAIITKLLTAVNVLVCVLLVLLVLLQRPKNEGLGAAFGGDTASNIFGAQTTNVLATLTRWLGATFLGMCLLIAVLGTYDKDRQGKIGAYVEQAKVEKAERDKKKKAEDEASKAAAAAADATKKPASVPAPTGSGKPEVPAPGVTPAVPDVPSINAEKPLPVPSSPEPGKTGDVKPAEKTPFGTAPADSKPVEAKPTEGKPSANPATPPVPVPAPDPSGGK
jgi:protein translocase SecG subunit